MNPVQSNTVSSPGTPRVHSGGAVKMCVFYFWKFVHNFVIHPLMCGPWREPKWLNDAHDWTAKRCPGAG